MKNDKELIEARCRVHLTSVSEMSTQFTGNRKQRRVAAKKMLRDIVRYQKQH